MSERIRVSIDPERLAHLLQPDFVRDAAINRIALILLSHDADGNLEMFLSEAIRALADERMALREALIRAAMNHTNVQYIEKPPTKDPKF